VFKNGVVGFQNKILPMTGRIELLNGYPVLIL
jgi:hypothetical protein